MKKKVLKMDSTKSTIELIHGKLKK